MQDDLFSTDGPAVTPLKPKAPASRPAPSASVAEENDGSGYRTFHPPLGADTSLASLWGWDLLLHCEKCGLRRKPAGEVNAHRALRIDQVLHRLVCDRCHAHPSRLTATCVWIREYGRSVSDIDLTWVIAVRRDKAA